VLGVGQSISRALSNRDRVAGCGKSILREKERTSDAEARQYFQALSGTSKLVPFLVVYHLILFSATCQDHPFKDLTLRP
jgi:hypothetical protein